MSERSRRFFAGNSLAQALAAAARYYGIEPGELAYRVREKRHGFVKNPRAVVLEVDPHAPRRAPGAPPAAPPAGPRREEPRREESRHEGSRREESRHEGPRSPRARPAPERGGHGAGGTLREADADSWRPADDEAAQAAGEAARRLLRLAGLDLEVRVRIDSERLEVELTGPDEERLRALGLEFLEDLEHLLPRAAHGLCGKLVRVRVEGAGLRAAREEQLRALARAAAERALAAGRDELLEPLDPAERRIVHLELKGRTDVVTESLGTGFLKRVRVGLTPR